jgi:hypothetical protein
MTIEGVTYHNNGNKQMQVIHTKTGFEVHKWCKTGNKKYYGQFDKMNMLRSISIEYENNSINAIVQYKKNEINGLYVKFIYEESIPF